MTGHDHIVTAFDADLRDLVARIAEMGGLVESLVEESVTALLRNDLALARRVIDADRRIDRMQHDADEKAVLVLARRQPVALDLRRIVGIMRTSANLERIGDLAKNNAKRVIAMDRPVESKRFTHGLQHMADLAMTQLKSVLDSYATLDLSAALKVRERDDEIDSLHTSLFRELLTYMMEDPRNISQCTHLLFCAKNIERIGDHATNIAETVHYVATGHQLSDERAKDDRSSYTRVEPPPDPAGGTP